MTKFTIGDIVRIKQDYWFNYLKGKKGTVKRILDNEGYCTNLYLLDMDEEYAGGATYSVTKPYCGKIILEEFLEYDS